VTHGADTSFLVAVEITEHPQHADAVHLAWSTAHERGTCGDYAAGIGIVRPYCDRCAAATTRGEAIIIVSGALFCSSKVILASGRRCDRLILGSVERYRRECPERGIGVASCIPCQNSSSPLLPCFGSFFLRFWLPPGHMPGCVKGLPRHGICVVVRRIWLQAGSPSPVLVNHDKSYP
jgi:hypothetical protein